MSGVDLKRFHVECARTYIQDALVRIDWGEYARAAKNLAIAVKHLEAAQKY